MPATTARGVPYPLTSDPFAPASVDFPALAAWIDANTGRNAASVLSAASVLDVGVLGQIRAGRTLTAADFTTLLGIAQPVGLWNLGSLTNLGSGGALVNKGSVPLTAKGIKGIASSAALFAGSTGQALYTADTGAADPFRIKTGSWGCWFRTAKRGTLQTVLAKTGAAANLGFALQVTAANVISASVSVDGSATTAAVGTTDVADDRWHFALATFDGSILRVLVDGAADGSVAATGSIFGSTAALNIGGQGADGATAATNPHFGRIDEGFVTGDVLDERQARVIMATSIAHGYPVTPTRAVVALGRRRRGGPLVTGDFSASPKHLYNFTAGSLADAGSLGNALTNNAAAASVAGAAGAANGAFAFAAASSQYLSATDTGMPAGTVARTVSAWFRTLASADETIVSYGVAGSATATFLQVTSTGLLSWGDNLSTTAATRVLSTAAVNDGQWHHAVGVYDPAAADGVVRKLYLDGRLVGGLTTAISLSTVLGGANAFRIGATPAGAMFFSGVIDGVAITDYAMTAEEVTSLYAKNSAPVLPPVPGDDPLEQIVQGFDATNVYVLGDVRKRVAGRVNSDGSIADAVGGDFRVVKTGTGAYTVYLPPSMFGQAVVPVVDSLGGVNTGAAVVAASPTTGAFSVSTYTSTTGAATDLAFSFVVEGRGPLSSQDSLDLRVAA